MNKEKKFSCSPIVNGYASGPALVSNEAICFYLVEPETGVVIEKGHILEGKSVEGKILVAHAGKGSSVVQLDGLFKLINQKKGPVGIILRNPDPVFVTALLVMEIPSVFDVENAFFDQVKDGQKIVIDATSGVITVFNEN